MRAYVGRVRRVRSGRGMKGRAKTGVDRVDRAGCLGPEMRLEGWRAGGEKEAEARGLEGWLSVVARIFRRQRPRPRGERPRERQREKEREEAI